MDRSRPLRIIHWNARGLARKAALLRPLLQEQDIDVALISETHLGPADRIKFPGFLVYRRDETAHRGLAVLIRRRVVHQPIPVTPYNTVYTLGVELHMAGAQLQLYAAYKPPQTPLDTTDVHALLDAPHPVIIAGDLNAKHPAWNSNTANRAGVRLHSDADARGYNVAGPEAPTHYPDQRIYSPDVLDVVVYNDNVHCQIHQQVLDDELQSDHQPVLVVLQDPPTRTVPLAPRRLIDWKLFSETLETTTPSRPVSSAEDAHELAAQLTTAIQGALDSATTTQHTQGRKQPLPDHIRRLIADKRRLRREWQSTRCP